MNRLTAILNHKRTEITLAKKRKPAKLLEKLAQMARAPLDFSGSIRRRNDGKIRLIAEVKRASPTAGKISSEMDVGLVAAQYAIGGASAISVLTDKKYFNGEIADLARVRQAVKIPVLRKDFILDEYQLLEARAAGADAVLLIAAALAAGALLKLSRIAKALHLQTLVEIHDIAELDTALACKPNALGINRRDLKTFRINKKMVEKTMPLVPRGFPVVAESGVDGKKDVKYLAGLGVDAVLVGEYLMRSGNPAAAVKELLS